MNRNFIHFLAGAFTTIAIYSVYNFFTNTYLSTATGRKKVLFFGDSITQHGNNPNNGWISNLAYWWFRRVDILNRGFSGYNSKWGLSIIDRAVIAESPDLVFVFFGANDAIDDQVIQHVPLDEYKRNLFTIINKIKKGLPRATVIVITPPPVWEPALAVANKAKGRLLLVDRNNVRTLQYAIACKEISKSLNVAVLDLWSVLEGTSDNRQHFLVDGLHLNTEGNVALFKAVTVLLNKEHPEWLPEMLPIHMPEWSQLSK